ncbi:MAG: sugar phosphate isomerase/epimerase [Clostridiales bacterium]|jgi:sugar phosphate isomerase/epimerase|nr:sugar phosphate isomerase/epimerase [Clostridiales bacterium]
MKLGIRGHDILEKPSWVGTLTVALKSAGLDTVQLVCYKSIDDVEYKANGISRDMAAYLGQILEECEINVALLGAYFNPVHPDAAKAELGVTVFKEYLSFAKELNAPLVASETGSYNGDKWMYHPRNRTPEALAAVTRTFGDLCRYAGEYGVSVGIEGAAGHVCHSVKALKSVINDIGAQNLKVVFDYYNFMDNENKDYAAILNEGLSTFDNIHCFHIKDCSLDSGAQVPVGQGDIDFPKILGMIKSYDKNAALILEGTAAKDAKQAGEFIKRVWDGV